MVTVNKIGSGSVSQDIVGVWRLSRRYFVAADGHSQVGEKDTQPFRKLEKTDKPPVLPSLGKFDSREQKKVVVALKDGWTLTERD